MGHSTAKAICFSLSIILFSSSTFLKAQDTTTRFVGHPLRIASGNNKVVDTTIRIFLSKDSLKKGHIIITVKEGKPFVLNIPDSSKFKFGDNPPDTLKFRFSGLRDTVDDRIIKFEVHAYKENGRKLRLTKDSVIAVMLKPYTTPLSSSSEFESWFFAGTNFDFFNGVKAEEFFFRWNSLFHITKNSYIQLAIYKNRYFSNDSTINTDNVFQKNGDFLLRDSLYSYTIGSYQKLAKTTRDPIGLQIDYLHKFSGLSVVKPDEYSKTFFASVGVDISAITSITEYTLFNFDTINVRTRNPDSTYHGKTFPFSPAKRTFRTRAGNINLGFLYIYDTRNINFKAQLTAGISFYTYPDPYFVGSNLYFSYPSTNKPYVQLRIFGTYKPFGISIGLDAYARKGNHLAVNATLSKVFDLDNFITTLSPVNALGIK